MGLAGFFGKIVGSGIGETADKIAGVVDRFVETEEEKKAAEQIFMRIQQKPDEWQAEINKIQAGHRTLFVAGARPFLMWICGFGFAIHFIVNPILMWITGEPGPNLDAGLLMDLTLAMLGLSGLRSYEKKLGLTK